MRLAGVQAKVFLLSLVFFAIGAMAVFFHRSFYSPEPAVLGETTALLPRAAEDFSQLAAQLAQRLNDISPTPQVADFGWVAEKISFVVGNPQAYIEYTDTHIALRLLLEYYTDANGDLRTKVLATFIPTEAGDWELQYGRDEAYGQRLRQYVYDPATQSWQPESKR